MAGEAEKACAKKLAGGRGDERLTRYPRRGCWAEVANNNTECRIKPNEGFDLERPNGDDQPELPSPSPPRLPPHPPSLSQREVAATITRNGLGLCRRLSPLIAIPAVFVDRFSHLTWSYTTATSPCSEITSYESRRSSA